MCTTTHVHTHRGCTETQTHRHIQQQLPEQCMHTLQVAGRHSIPQERQKDSVAQADTVLQTLMHGAQCSATHTHAHQPLPLALAHTQRIWSSTLVLTYDTKTKTLLEMEVERLHWEEKKEYREGISCYILLRDFFSFGRWGFPLNWYIYFS